MGWIERLISDIQMAPEIWITAAVIVVSFCIFSGVAADMIFRTLRIFLRGVTEDTWDSLKSSFRGPLKVFIMLAGLSWGLEVLPLSDKTDLIRVRYLRTGFILTAAYGAYHLEGVLAALFRKVHTRMNMQSSEILKQFSLRIIRFIVAVLAVTLVAEQFGINAGSIVAGLGIAGLAVALAAQDTLSNIFAGIVLILDKPFDVGELVEVESLMGTVENINFRSTRLRLLTQELVTIPNSAIAKGPITNLTRRSQRRAIIRLELGKDVHRKVVIEFCEDLEEILKVSPGIDPTTVLVRLESYEMTGPVLSMMFLTDSAEWDDFVNTRQEAIFSLMEALERHEIKTAKQRVQFESISE